MTGVLTALGMLVIGAAASLAISFNRRAALFIGMTALGLAGAACVASGIVELTQSIPARESLTWPMPLGATRLALDGLSAWFLLPIGVVAIAVAIYSWGYYGGGTDPALNRFYAPLLCALVGAMVLLVLAADAVLFLLSWELVSLAAFFLVGLRDTDRTARRAAWMYLIATHIATALGVLPVMAAFVGRSGTTELSAFAGAYVPGDTTACICLFVLGFIGFGTKAGFMPFHIWLPIAHPVAPSPVSAIMSGVVIKMGIYGLLRLLSWLPALPASCAAGMALVSGVTALAGISYALGQRNLKRMLAYSSVENIGIVGIAIAVAMLGRSLQQPALVALGIAGALLHVLNHAFFKSLLFLSAGTVLHGAGTADIERLGGLARTTAINSAAFLLGSIAICSLPPLNGFIGEYVIYTGLLIGLQNAPILYAATLALCVAVLALTGAIALAAFAGAYSVVFLGEPRDPSIHSHATPRTMNAAVIVLSIACVTVVALAGRLATPLAAATHSITPEANAVTLLTLYPASSIPPVVVPFMVFVALTLGLLLARRAMPRPSLVAPPTWGCGYAFPTPTMQYSGSSFAWKLLAGFRQLLRARTRSEALSGHFPQRQQRTIDLPDIALERVYRPAFRRFTRACESLWPLQHGRVQLYLMYIVVTLFLVFFVEAWFEPFVASVQPDAAHASHAVP